MTAVSTRLDWLSFTLEIDPDDPDRPTRGLPTDMRDYVQSVLGRAVEMPDPLPERGRFPYRMSTSGGGMRLFWTPGTYEILVEISGEGCERLHETGRLETIVESHLHRITRADLATDILTETTPEAFTDQRTNKRHKSYEKADSPTGQTVYIGSRKSDRYVRVYRYAKPHPRSDRLRIECVYRGHQAIALCTTWLEHGDDETAARAGNQYGWQHPDWTPKSEEKIPAWRPDRKTHNRMHWYHSQVVPALRGLVAQGLLTPEQLVKDVTPDRAL